MKKIKFIFTSALLLITFVYAAQAFATQGGQQWGKVDICHATDSNSNPYVAQSPNIQNDGSLSGGHLNHTGLIWYQGINGKWGDIIPPYKFGNFHYSGLNWTSQGQAIHDNGCNKVTATPTPTVTPTPKHEECGDGYNNFRYGDDNHHDDNCPTPTPKKDDCDNQGWNHDWKHDDNCPSTTPTPTLTPTPTETPTVTPTQTPTEPSNPGGPGDGLGCATHDCSTHPAPATTQAVLGASTSVLGLSNTASSDASQREAILFVVSLTMLSAGAVILRKNA